MLFLRFDPQAVTEKPCLKLLEKFREIVSTMQGTRKGSEVAPADATVSASQVSKDDREPAETGK